MTLARRGTWATARLVALRAGLAVAVAASVLAVASAYASAQAPHR